MKKLFFSLVLGTVIAVCWVMIIHTLKWIAIRGNEFELVAQQRQHHHHQYQGALGGPLPPPPMPPLAQPMMLRSESALALASPFDGGGGGAAVSSLRTAHLVIGLSVSEAPTLEGLRAAAPASHAHPPVSVGPSWAGQRAQAQAQAQQREEREERKKGIYSLEGQHKEDGNNNNNSVGEKHQAAQKRVGRQATAGELDDNDDSASSAADPPDPSDLTIGRPKPLPLGSGSGSLARPAGPLPSIASGAAASAASERQVTPQKRLHLSRIAPQQRRPAPSATPLSEPSADNQAEGPLRGETSAGSGRRLELAANPALGDDLGSGGGGGSGDGGIGGDDDGSDPDGLGGGLDSQQQQARQPQTGNKVPRPGGQLERGAQVAGLLYKAPFFTSWFVSIWNILFMPVFTLISSCCFRNEDSTTKKLLVESISQFMDNGLTTFQFLGRCAFFSVLWIGTIFGIVYALSNIDATVVMALFACSAALVYLLSWVLLHQQFVGVRIVAVIICTTGIALLAYMDNSQRTLGSVLIVAGSALCSAVYKVIYQRMFGFWSIAQMSLFFTLIGLFNAFLMWPVALLLYFLGVELIVWRYIPWMHLTAAGALHLTANILAYFGPICSYNVFLTMGLLLAVVLSAVIDVTFYKINFSGMKLAGVLLLMIGFLVCLLPENWNEFLYDLVNERFVRWKKQRSLKKTRNKVQDLSTGQMSRLRTPSGRVK